MNTTRRNTTRRNTTERNTTRRVALMAWHVVRTLALAISWPVRWFRELDQEVDDALVVTTTGEQAMVQGQVAAALMPTAPMM